MSDNIFNCQYFERCKNSHKCFLCNDLRLLSLPKDKWNQKYRKRSSKADAGWRGLEQQVADMLNAIPTAKSAYSKLKREQIIGQTEWDKQSIKVEYNNTVTVPGEYSVTVYQHQLGMFMQNSFDDNKIFIVSFSFKNDDTVYMLMDFDSISDLVTHLKFLIDENIRFKEQLTSDEYEESVFPKLSESHRQLRSGGIWTMPGDIKDQILLVEAKQRTSKNKAGEFKFSIKRRVLEKVDNEATGSQIPTLVFRMNDDENIYSVMKYEYLMELITQLNFAYEENKLLQQEVLK